MSKKTFVFTTVFALIALLVVGALAFFFTQPTLAADLIGKGGPGGRPTRTQPAPRPTQTQPAPRPTRTQRPTATPSAPLTAEEAAGLQLAIAEEYGARALYEGVLQDFPEASLFARIARSEMQHALSLTRLADKYGVSYPAYPGPTDTEFESIEAACAAGVEAEIADAALYDEVMAYTTHADLLQVYTALQNASLNSHLPAFEACNY